MQIKVTKAGLYAVHHCWGPNIELAEGQEITDAPPFTTDFLNTMVDDWKCGERIPDPAATVDRVDPETAIRATIQSVIDLGGDKNDAKKLLEAWGKDNFGIDIDRSKKLEEVTEELVEAALNAG